MERRVPLGIIPRFIWIDERISHIERAIEEFVELKCDVPFEYVEELNELRSTYPRVKRDFYKRHKLSELAPAPKVTIGNA